MSKTIYAYHGEAILVDDADYEMLSQYRWHIRNGCVVRSVGCGGKRGMVYDILGIESQKGMRVTHINGNSLDNRKTNLRLVTSTQNVDNKVPHKNTVLKYDGVYLDKSSMSNGADHPWKWAITGSCATEEEAIRSVIALLGLLSVPTHA